MLKFLLFHLLCVHMSTGLRTGFQVGQAKNWVSPSDCSTISEVSAVCLLNHFLPLKFIIQLQDKRHEKDVLQK